jgi:hypothetical protein
MADSQALFAYRVQLPDGSETVRTGGADRAPTHGELADYAANQGERYLGPVEMSPNLATGSAPAEAPPAPPPAAPVVPDAAAATPPPTPTLGSVARDTLLPNRTFFSELPSIGLATGVGAVSGPFAPLTVPVAAAVGEAGQVGLEHAMGWPAAEPGTLAERMERAGVRGLAGEAIAAPVRIGAKLVQRAVGPVLGAAEEVAPVLAQDLPATVKAVPNAAAVGGYRNIGHLLNDPAELAGAQLSPEGQQTLLRAWWQRQAPQGAGAVVDAWDGLAATPGAQQALAGGQHEAMTTLVDSLRGAASPLKELANKSWGQMARQGALPTALTLTGHYYAAPAAAVAQEFATSQAPRALLSSSVAPTLAWLPQAARTVATPADMALRFGTQSAATKVLP